MMSMLRTAIMVIPTPRPNFDSPPPPAAPQASFSIHVALGTFILHIVSSHSALRVPSMID